MLVNHSDEDVKSHWHSLKTIFDREEKRQRGSKKSGASSAEVYKTNWKYFNLLTFTKDCTAFDPSKSTMASHQVRYEASEWSPCSRVGETL